MTEAVDVYVKGEKMQIPPEECTTERALKRLQDFDTFVYKERGKISALIVWTYKTEFTIDMIFICSLNQRKGIATKLVRHLAEYAKENKVIVVYSNVSSEDERTIKFYEKCGFERFGKPYEITGTVIYPIKSTPDHILNSIRNRPE